MKSGIAIGGRKNNKLRYTDDTLIIAQDEHKLINIMQRLDELSRRYGLEIDNSKTKVINVERANSNSPNIANVAGYPVVNHFEYLESVVTNITRIWKETFITTNTNRRINSETTANQNQTIHLCQPALFKILWTHCQ